MPYATDLLTARASVTRAIAHLANANGSPVTPTLTALLDTLRAVRTELGALIEPAQES